MYLSLVRRNNLNDKTCVCLFAASQEVKMFRYPIQCVFFPWGRCQISCFVRSNKSVWTNQVWICNIECGSSLRMQTLVLIRGTSNWITALLWKQQYQWKCSSKKRKCWLTVWDMQTTVALYEHGTSHMGHMVMWLVVRYWLSMSPATHMSKLICLRFCRRPMRCIVQQRGAHRTETVNAERSKTRKHHRTDLITRLPPGWIYNGFFNNARCSVSRLNTSCFFLFMCRDQGRVCLKKWWRCGSLGLNISYTMLIRIHTRKRQTPAKQAECLFGSALPWIINLLSFSQSQQ